MELEKSKIQEIIVLHNEIAGQLKLTFEKAAKIGKLLTEQKAAVKHGKWLAWIRENMPFNCRTAERYVSLFKEQDILKIDTVSNLNEAYRVIKESKYKEKLKRNEEYEKKILQFKEDPTLTGLPEGYYEREKVILTKEEPNVFIVCLVLGPNNDHPYLETADFRLDDMSCDTFKGMSKEELFDQILDLHELGKARCSGAGTWGNYLNPKMQPGGATHFIKYSSGNKPKWFTSGLEHGIPKDAFKIDISFIEIDPGSEEAKAKVEIEGYNRKIEGHHKEKRNFKRRSKQ